MRRKHRLQIISLLLVFALLLGSQYYPETAAAQEGLIYSAQIVNPDGYDLSEIEISVSSSSLIFSDEASGVKQYENNYEFTVSPDEDGYFSFAVPEIPFRVKFEADTLPQGSAMAAESHLFTSAEESFEWYIAELADCEVLNPALCNADSLTVQGTDAYGNTLMVHADCTAEAEYKAGAERTAGSEGTQEVIEVQYRIAVGDAVYTDEHSFSLADYSDEAKEAAALEYSLTDMMSSRGAVPTGAVQDLILNSDNGTVDRSAARAVSHPLSQAGLYTYTDRQYVISSSGFFRVFYEGTGDYAITQSRAQIIAGRLDAIHSYFTGLGFLAPLRGTETYFNVYLIPRTYSVGDMCIEDQQITDTTCSTYLLIRVQSDTTLNPYFYGILAHEYFHAVTCAYRSDLEDSLYWFSEGVATWAGIAYMKYYRSSASTAEYAGYVDSYLSQPRTAMNTLELSGAYGAFLLPLYVQQTRGSITTMRSVMEKWAVYSSPFYAFHYGLTAANPAYALTTTFLGMCTFNYRPSAFYYYADSSWPDFDDATYGQIITADASGVSSVLPMMSFDYKKVAPAVSSGTCQIELISSGNGSPYYKLVRETSDGTYSVLSLSEGTGNVDYTITVSSVGTAGTTKALTIVAANCSTITGDMTYHYSVDIN